MKAKTKAARRRAGRPRDEGVMRTESGRKSRSAEAVELEERLTLEAATWKRRQQWVPDECDEEGNVRIPGHWRTNPNMSVEKARLQERGSVIHAWKVAHDRFIDKYGDDIPNPMMFTESDLETARQIHEAYIAYRIAIASRNPRSASDFGAPGGFDGSDPFDSEKAKHDKQAINRWIGEGRKGGLRDAILKSGPLGMMAVEAIVFENKAAQSLIGDLRVALNSVDRASRLRRAA